MGDPQPDPNETLALAEETLSVSTRRVETGRVHIGVRTESEVVQANASLLDHRVEVERVPVGREVAEVPEVREEGDVTIYPVLEEILVVEKRLVLKEEVRVRRITSRSEVSQPVTLRRQRADIERIAQQRDNPSEE